MRKIILFILAFLLTTSYAFARDCDYYKGKYESYYDKYLDALYSSGDYNNFYDSYISYKEKYNECYNEYDAYFND